MLSSKYVLQHVLLTEYLTLNRCLSFPENTPAFDKNTPAFSEKTGCLKTKLTRIKNDSRIFFFQNSRQSDRLYFHTYLSPFFYLLDSLINEVIQAFSVSDFSRTSVPDYYSVGTYPTGKMNHQQAFPCYQLIQKIEHLILINGTIIS